MVTLTEIETQIAQARSETNRDLIYGMEHESLHNQLLAAIRAIEMLMFVVDALDDRVRKVERKVFAE